MGSIRALDPESLAAPLERLRQTLDRHQYDLVVREGRGANYFLEAAPSGEALAQLRYRLADLSRPLRTLVQLFSMLDEVWARDAAAVLGPRTVVALCEIGLLEERGSRLSTGEWILLPRFGGFFWSRVVDGGERRDSGAYIGRDVLRLADWLPRRPGRRVLDLRCGSGMVGICAAWAADTDRVLLLDDEPEALAVAQLNVLLNGVGKRVEVRRGTVAELAPEETFELIAARLPHLAVPLGLSVPAAVDGGERGLGPLLATLAAVPAHLAPEGQFRTVLPGLGDAEQPWLLPELRRFVEADEQAFTHVVLTFRGLQSRELIEQHARMLLPESVAEETVAQMTDAFWSHYQELGGRYLYWQYLRLRRVAAGTPSLPAAERVRVTRAHAEWEPHHVPRPAVPFAVQPSESFDLVCPPAFVEPLQPLAAWFLEAVDGERSVEEIYERVRTAEIEPFLGEDTPDFLPVFLDLCQEYSEKGLLLPPDAGTLGDVFGTSVELPAERFGGDTVKLVTDRLRQRRARDAGETKRRAPGNGHDPEVAEDDSRSADQPDDLAH